jgi:anaerobic magnesium-protoporphyrin IX monomethyl ester cyclase
MKLLLTHGYFLAEDPKELRIMKPYVPLGILSLSAHLRNKGFEVEIYDSTFGSREELFKILDSGPAAALGIYGNLLTRRNVLDIAARASAAGWKVILGLLWSGSWRRVSISRSGTLDPAFFFLRRMDLLLTPARPN